MPNEEDVASDFDFWISLNYNYFFILNGTICSLKRHNKKGTTTPQAIVCKDTNSYEVNYTLIDVGFLFLDQRNKYTLISGKS